MRDVWCFIQARSNSTRLPGKMFLTLGGVSLVHRAYYHAQRIFGYDRVAVLVPTGDMEMYRHVSEIVDGERIKHGPENDVLTRFYLAARHLNVAPDAFIARWTPDDWCKDDDAIRQCAGFSASQSLIPVAQGVEVFSRKQLEILHWETPSAAREHIGYLLDPHGQRPLPPDDGLPWSIDTQADYDAVVAKVGR